MNHFEIALQVLEKINAEIPVALDSAPVHPSEERLSDFAPVPEALGIHEYIDSMRPLPDMTLLLGKCEDGLPILVDLENPCSGSILISSRSQGRGRFLMKALLTSARSLNCPDRVQSSLITSHSGFYGEVATASQCHQNFHPAHRDAGRYILDVSALVEQRYSGRRRGPVLLVAIDDLVAFERGAMDNEVFSHLQWIVREGPEVRIWPIIVMAPEQDGVSNDELISQFGTRIVDSAGSASSRRSQLLAGYADFEVSTGAEFLRFTVPGV